MPPFTQVTLLATTFGEGLTTTRAFLVTVKVRNASQLAITSVVVHVQVGNYSDDSVRVSTPLMKIVIPLVPT